MGNGSPLGTFQAESSPKPTALAAFGWAEHRCPTDVTAPPLLRPGVSTHTVLNGDEASQGTWGKLLTFLGHKGQIFNNSPFCWLRQLVLNNVGKFQMTGLLTQCFWVKGLVGFYIRVLTPGHQNAGDFFFFAILFFNILYIT